MLEGEIVLVNDFLGNIAAVDAHVLVNEHVREKEKIFQVASAITGTKMGIRNDTIQMDFGVNDTNSRRTDILIRIKTITTNRHADSEDFSFARSHCAEEVGVSYLAASRDLMRENEHNSVVANNGIVDQARFVEALCASSPLVRQGFEPDGRVRTTEKGVNVFSLTSDGIVHLASYGRVVVDRLGKMGTHRSLRIKAKLSETRASANNG